MNGFKTALALMKQKFKQDLKDYGMPLEATWRTTIQMNGACPSCKEKGFLRVEEGIWYCLRCEKNFTAETIYNLYPVPEV